MIDTATAWRGAAAGDRWILAIRDYLTDCIILFSAYLVAIYLRRELPFGKYVGSNYQWHRADLYLTIAVSLLAVHALRLLLARLRPTVAHDRLWTGIAGVAASCLGLTVFVPDQSGLEKGYFALAALILVALVVPSQDDTRISRVKTRESFIRLWANRSLLRIWVQYNVKSRYAQAFLGILWIILLPLSTALVMSVVFSQIMRIPTRNAPFIVFFLAGFVPWGLFNQSISGGMRSILSVMGLINQIYFPREIIVLSALGEALVDTFFMFLAMLIINALFGVFPNFLYVILPLLLLIQLALCLGLMLVVSWLSVLVRDVPQLVSVVLQILFYASPIIYPVGIVPHRFRFLITLNPVAVIIDAYHRIIVYGSQPDWYSLLYPAALGVAILIFGYRLFKSNEDLMADLV